MIQDCVQAIKKSALGVSSNPFCTSCKNVIVVKTSPVLSAVIGLLISFVDTWQDDWLPNIRFMP